MRLRGEKCIKYWIEVKNYIATCRTSINFNTEDDVMKNELIKELSNWLGPKKEEESILEYLDRKSKENSNRKDEDVFSIPKQEKKGEKKNNK